MSNVVYLGVKGSVVAIDKRTGRELWRTHLNGSSLTTLMVDEDVILAYTRGHLYGINPESGRQIWHNKLPGLGHGFAALAMRGAAGQDVSSQAQQAQAAAAAAAVAASAAVASSAAANG